MNSAVLCLDTYGGTRYISAVSIPYAGTMTLPLLEKVAISRGVNLYNKTIENATLTADLIDASGWIDEKLLGNDVHLPGRDIQCFDNLTRVFSGKVSDLPSSEIKRFQIKGDTFTMLKKEVLPRITTENHPDAPSESIGKPGNILLGTANDVGFREPQGMLEAWMVDDTKYYLAAWHPLSELLKVYDENGNNVTASCTLVHFNGNAYIKYNIASPTDKYLRFNAKGPDDSGELIQNPADMLDYAVTNFGEFDIDGVSEAAAIFTARGFYTGNCITINKGETTWKDVLSDFSRSFGCFVFPTRIGKIRMKLLELGADPVVEIHPSYLLNFSPERNIEEVYGKWKAKYCYHFTSGQYEKTHSYEANNTLLRIKPEVERKFVIKDNTATDVIEREAALHEQTLILYKFGIPRHLAKEIELCDTVRLQPNDANFFDDARDVFILREKRSHKGFVQYEAIDVTVLDGRVV